MLRADFAQEGESSRSCCLCINTVHKLKAKKLPHAHVACAQSLCLNLKIDIYIHETPGGAHDEVMRGVL